MDKILIVSNSNGNDNLSTSSKNKSVTISSSTIIYSIERDLKELLKELNVRAQKDQIKSILESTKMLKKKCTIQNNLEFSDIQTTRTNDSKITDFPKTFKRSGTQIEKNLVFPQNKEFNSLSKKNSAVFPNNNKGCLSCERLKNEIDKLQNELTTAHNKISVFLKKEENERMIKEKYDNLSEDYKQLLNKIELVQCSNEKSITEYKEKTGKLEEALKIMNNEYDKLCKKIGDIHEKNDLLLETNSKLQKNLKVYKNKFDNITNVNESLSKKVIETETRYNLLKDELSNSNNKNAKLLKANNILLTKNKQMIEELENKENRLKALREMNTILEKKSNKLIVNFGNLLEKNKETNQN